VRAMSGVVAARKPALPARLRAARPSGTAVAGAGLAALVLLSLLLRTRALDAGFWIDEGLSVGIASHGFLEIPEVLRLDGSPPLYYLLLHVWMQAFGDGEVETHALSLVFAVLCVPVAFLSARGLFGERAAWIAAILAATSTFLTFYAQETRMYSLVALESFVVTASCLQLFVVRDRRWLVPFALSLTALVYTHNWGLFLAAATLVVVALEWRRDRGVRRDAVIAYGITGALFAPWLPSLVFQALNTGAPWATRPSWEELVSALGTLMGGPTPGVALLLAAGAGIAGPVQARDRRAVALVALAVAAVGIAFLANQASPAFASRYFSVFVGPLLLIAAVGLARAGRLGIVALVLVFAFWLDPRTSQVKSKSNVRSVAASIQTVVTTGDLVVSTHPEQLPLLAYYLPEGPRYATALGLVDDPRVFDWRDALDRLRAARPKATIDRLVATMRPGQELVLVQPIIRTYAWDAPWTSLVRRRVAQWERALDGDPRFRREAAVPVFGFGRLPRGVRAVVYRLERPTAQG